ncbi:hypothetical protein QPM17_03730 [Marinobacter sp. TBZ242]|uniref:Uncharacterized protein n=1 Tax=Marinobacter azerbaijanicus TaxID=3050455 RepID=A0ABT7I7T9_9GAMM|nr:hypothetical protein [Marinobacter sp. TBZ242]MDL0430219.1 hypothetical protein [Marinobacter sp. TBZ242]
MARPKGGRNIRPSKSAILDYYKVLRDAANSGDVNAAAKLIELDHLTSQSPRPQKFEMTRGCQ